MGSWCSLTTPRRPRRVRSPDLGAYTAGVGSLGEFGVIARLRRALPPARDERLIVGIGDDAAVWRVGAGFTIATTDTMVEGIHFRRESVEARDIGWKALATNISDIAAMGGVPAFALVTLCLPPSAAPEWLDELYAGLRECAEGYGVTVAGGDIVAAPVLAITIALTGEPSAWAADGMPLLLRRDGAQPGDVIAVTGALGGSAGGLRMLQDERADCEDARALAGRHVRPRPRVDAGKAAVAAGVRCGIDVSDGFVQDLGHICAASGSGAIVRVDDVPADPALTALFPDDARTLVCTGGEDYELVLVGPHAAIDATSAALAAPLRIVGEITDDPEHRVRVIDGGGNEVSFEEDGWDHLKIHPWVSR